MRPSLPEKVLSQQSQIFWQIPDVAGCQLGHQSDGATPARLFLRLNLEEERLVWGETPLWLWAGGKAVVGGSCSQVCGVGARPHMW